jgi:hypothetical protein
VTLTDADIVIERLRAAVDRVGANLVEIERDPHRQLLDAATLRGETATRWIGARSALADLFDAYARMTAYVEHVTELRRQASFDPRLAPDLDAMLTGPVIELSSASVGIDERGLFDGSRKVTRCTADQLLARMANDFEIAKAAVFGVAQAWDGLVPRVAAVRETLMRAEAQVVALGETRPELASVRGQLDALGELIAEDPLAVDARAVDELEAAAVSVARDVERADGLRRDLGDRVAACRAEIDALTTAGQRGSAVEREARAKIALPPKPDSIVYAAELGTALDRVIVLADGAQWRSAERELMAWQAACADARSRVELGAANARAALAYRDELRGRLDAYGAKAASCGLAEHAQLTRMFDAAQRALYTAPTDLEQAEVLVRKYQDAVNAAPGRKAAM